MLPFVLSSSDWHSSSSLISCRLRTRDRLEMNSLEFIIKFRADSLSDKMAFPLELVKSSKNMTKAAKMIYLEGPSGNLWEVKLSKKGGHLYLEDGWKEFVQDHCVMEDDHLVFKYCGKSCFTVLIFDESGCERAASYFVKNGRVSRSTKALREQQKYISQTSEVNECSFTKLGLHDDTQLSSDDDSFCAGFSSSGTSHSKKKNCPGQSFKSFRAEKHCINEDASKIHSSLKTRTEKKITVMKKNGSKAEACALRLMESISKSNPCFLKVLPASSIRTKLYLVLPKDFVIECKLFIPQITKLQIPRKKEWLVEYTRVGKSWVLIWKTFVKDNRLKEGDVCVFELTVSRPKMVMVVHIFRA